MGEALQRQIWHPHWKMVEAEDAEMKISEWVSCCSARSGTAMDLGLDYFRVLLALGFCFKLVLHTKIGMAGRGYWGKPPGL